MDLIPVILSLSLLKLTPFDFFLQFATQHWPLHWLDIKNVFLHIDLEEEIFMEQPHGFIMGSLL